MPRVAIHRLAVVPPIVRSVVPSISRSVVPSIVLAVVLAAACAPSPNDPAPRLVGQLLDEVIPDSALYGSWRVYPLERYVGIRHVVVDGRHVLVADTLDGYDGSSARWRIRQAQTVETPRAGEGYVASCALPGADAADGTVVARVTLSANEALEPVHDAWRLDPATWRFAPFPPDSLACYNEGGG